MKLSMRETQMLDELSGKGQTGKELANALGMRQPNVSRCLKKLEEFGLVNSEKRGRKREVSINASLKLGLSNLKVKFPEIKFGWIMRGYFPYLLAFARGRKEFGIAQTGIPPATAKRVLANLRSRGIFSMQKKGEYGLRGEAGIVGEFCRGALIQMMAAKARRDLGEIEYGLYSFGTAGEAEGIFVAKKEAEVPGYWKTFTGISGNYGLNLMPAGKFYYVNSRERPDLGDLIIHALALNRDSRGIIYAAYLAIKNKYNPLSLLKKRQDYGLGQECLEGFARFVETRGKIPFEGLNSFEEVEALGNGAV